ncbi:MAG: UDP-N-acetylmuramoyl-tripeptide--D-alanyl-D-alanine ligase [Thermoleophilia bacterium]|jgi:UDP-N-acetylmuramoyl-tripeptide--D-alanyl-D-alanine ligase
MIVLTAEEVAQALDLHAFSGPVEAVGIDTRTMKPGDLFVALRGERFDGHAFVETALAKGASAVLVDKAWWEGDGAGMQVPGMCAPIHPVADTLEALGALARAVRRKSGAKVIAVTGSVGKTGTKDLIAAMAGRTGRVVSTTANQNNEVGVPLTLLALEPDTQIAVVEMGMRGPGQIAALTRMAEPDVGVITAIHPVHLEFLGSLEGIAEAKAELILALGPAGTAVIPADCDAILPHVADVRARVLRFALNPNAGGADVWGAVRTRQSRGSALVSIHWPHTEAEVELPFTSRHRLENTMAAVAACYAADLPVELCLSGAADVVFTSSRGDVATVGEWVVIDDTYNASPAAVRAAVDDLVELAQERGGRPVAVLGDMLELGPEAERFHEECGAYAARMGVQALWGVGPLSRATSRGFCRAAGIGQRAGHLETVSEAGPVLSGLQPGDVILFKASRSVELDTMVSAVMQSAGCSRTDGTRTGAGGGS